MDKKFAFLSLMSVSLLVSACSYTHGEPISSSSPPSEIEHQASTTLSHKDQKEELLSRIHQNYEIYQKSIALKTNSTDTNAAFIALDRFRKDTLTYLRLSETWDMSDEDIQKQLGKEIVVKVEKKEGIRLLQLRTTLLGTQQPHSFLIQYKQNQVVSSHQLFDWTALSLSRVTFLTKDTLIAYGHQTVSPFSSVLGVFSHQGKDWTLSSDIQSTLSNSTFFTINEDHNLFLFSPTSLSKTVQKESTSLSYDKKTKLFTVKNLTKLQSPPLEFSLQDHTLTLKK